MTAETARSRTSGVRKEWKELCWKVRKKVDRWMVEMCRWMVKIVWEMALQKASGNVVLAMD